MVSHRKVKELKVGTNTADNLDYLKSLTADFFADRKNEELLDAWNHLQKTPGRTRIFTFATKRCPELIARYLEEHYPSNVIMSDGKPQWLQHPEPPYYAYIKHDSDTPGHVDPNDPESGIHYHFFLEYSNPRSFASVATELGIPVTMLQGIKVNKRAVLQYLTHENDPNKHHYSLEDIHSNFNVIEARQEQQFDSRELANDYYLLRSGKITYKEFYDKYAICIVRHSFSQQLGIFEKMWNAENNVIFSARHGPV